MPIMRSSGRSARSGVRRAEPQFRTFRRVDAVLSAYVMEPDRPTPPPHELRKGPGFVSAFSLDERPSTRRRMVMSCRAVAALLLALPAASARCSLFALRRRCARRPYRSAALLSC